MLSKETILAVAKEAKIDKIEYLLRQLDLKEKEFLIIQGRILACWGELVKLSRADG